MERQRSFTFKPTRFLVFSFTIFSSLVCLTFFYIWVLKSSPPSAPPAVNLVQFNRSTSLALHKPLSSLRANNFSAGGGQNLIFIDTHVSKAENNSGFDGVSDFDELQRKETKRREEMVETETTGTNATSSLFGENRVGEVSSSDGKFQVLNSGKKMEREGVKNTCDLSKGKWVYDESYPLYRRSSCAFIDEGFDCEGNGRLDKDYTKWRWQPQYCDLHRFNATEMLEMIRGKRLVFVGDSINRNQWESMLCLLMGAIKDPKKVYETHRRRITKEKGNYSFKFLDYKCTVEYYVTHFLVHESKARVGKKRVQTLRIDTMDRSSSRWRGADILVFNTAHWWSHYKTKSGMNYYQEGNQVHPRLDSTIAFRRALTTWSLWVDSHINPRKTQVFFRTSAPSHFSEGQWNSGGHCTEVIQPLNETSRFNYPEKNRIIEEVVKRMKTPVRFLNITYLSDYRIDGHPSIYGRKPEQRVSSSSIQDCSHWCLPGVPDTWNQLLYVHLKQRDRV